MKFKISRGVEHSGPTEYAARFVDYICEVTQGVFKLQSNNTPGAWSYGSNILIDS